MTDDKLGTNDTLEYTEEAQRHAQKISENYRKLLDKATAPERYIEPEQPKSSAVFEEPVYNAPEEENVVPETAEEYAREGSEVYSEHYAETYPVANNAARISEYTAHPAPKTKKVLFEGVTYTKGGYMHGPNDTAIYSSPIDNFAETVVEAPAVEMPVQEEIAAPEAEMSAVAEVAEDDCIPTPRTMLHRTVTEEEEPAVLRLGFWAMLSTKMRAALAAVTTAIFVAVMLVCINTTVLNNLNTDIANKRLRLKELRDSADGLQEQIDVATDPGNVDQWAIEHGMVR